MAIQFFQTANFANSVTATSFVKSGGTSSQYLMADGSVSTGSSGVAWTDITSKPTTISGFGITDAFDGAYSSLTGTPTIPTDFVSKASGGTFGGSVKITSSVGGKLHLRSTDTAIVNGDYIGNLYFEGVDSGGNADSIGASIHAIADGTWSNTVAPTELIFKTRNTTGGTTTALTLNKDQSATFAGTISASNFSGTSSGTNTGDQDLSGYALSGDVFSGDYDDLSNKPTILTSESDTLASVTGRGSSTTTSCTFNTITMNTPVVGTSNKIKFGNNDYIRYDDSIGVGRFHFDSDGGTNNSSVQAATFVGALSGNASTASKWATARTITLGGDLTGSVSIDGSANVTLSGQVTNDSHDHTRILERSTITYGASQLQWTDLSGTGGSGTNGNAPGNPYSDWHHHIIMNHGNSNGYYVDMAFSFHDDRVHFRRLEGGTLEPWREFFHTGHPPTAAEVGAAPSSHNHDSSYVNVTGDTMTGQLTATKLRTNHNGSQAAPRYDTSFYVAQSQHYYGQNGSQTMYLGESGNDVLIRGQVAIGGTAIQSGYDLTLSGHVDLNSHDINYVNQLHFSDDVRFYDDGNDNYLNFKWGDTGSGGIKFRDGNSNIHGYVYGNNDDEFGFLDADGNWAVRIDKDTAVDLRINNSSRLICDTGGTEFRNGGTIVGEVTTSGVARFISDVIAYYSYSDQRLKTDIKATTNNLDKILKLEPVEYTWKDGGREGKKEIGLIAQDVEKVVPEVVRENERLNDDTLYKQVDYEHLVSTLIGAIQEQQDQIAELKSEVTNLKSTMCNCKK